MPNLELYDGSKPFTPGEHQNSLQMGVHLLNIHNHILVGGFNPSDKY